MSEAWTGPVRAIPLDEDAFHQTNVAGSFFVADPNKDREQLFWYRCPCGCGAKKALLVGDGFQPKDGPSWQWNGSLAAATLIPSVHHIGHWHGWLKNGIWESC